MKIIKKNNLKLFLGVAVLILFMIIFFLFRGPANLEKSNMHHWQSASLQRRAGAINILTGGDAENSELMLQCMDKIASLPNSSKMTVRDSAALCYTGIKLKQNI